MLATAARSYANSTVYHETLWEAMQAAFDAIPKGHGVDIEQARDQVQPMQYEQGQTLRLDLAPDASLPRRARRSVLAVYLYRMPSGRYEVTSYAA